MGEKRDIDLTGYKTITADVHVIHGHLAAKGESYSASFIKSKAGLNIPHFNFIMFDLSNNGYNYGYHYDAKTLSVKDLSPHKDSGKFYFSCSASRTSKNKFSEMKIIKKDNPLFQKITSAISEKHTSGKQTIYELPSDQLFNLSEYHSTFKNNDYFLIYVPGKQPDTVEITVKLTKSDSPLAQNTTLPLTMTVNAKFMLGSYSGLLNHAIRQQEKASLNSKK